MLEKIDDLLLEVQNFQSSAKDEIEQFRLKFNGKKGIMNDFYDSLKQIPNEQKKDFGQKINILRNAINEKLVKSFWRKKILQDQVFLWNWDLVIQSTWLKIELLKSSNPLVLLLQTALRLKTIGITLPH